MTKNGRYVPLNQKYRPRRLSKVVGQDVAVGVISGLLESGETPPTMLLAGPHSSGKTTLARIIAMRHNCQKPNGAEPCLKCDSCTSVPHPDVVELNAADSRGIDTIRSLSDVCQLAPTYNKRVFIFDECHMLTPQAFQSSLKMFEEPPSTACFLLATTNPEKLPDTIMSRCSLVKLRPIRAKVLAEWLVSIASKESLDLEDKQALRIAQAAEGHPREALTSLEQVIAYSKAKGKVQEIDNLISRVVEDSPKKLVAEFLRCVINRKVNEAYQMLSQVSSADQFLKACVELMRGVVRYAVDPKLVGGYWKYQLVGFGKVKLEDATDVLRVFARALQTASTYVMPADVLLDLAVAECA